MTVPRRYRPFLLLTVLVLLSLQSLTTPTFAGHTETFSLTVEAPPEGQPPTFTFSINGPGSCDQSGVNLQHEQEIEMPCGAGTYVATATTVASGWQLIDVICKTPPEGENAGLTPGSQSYGVANIAGNSVTAQLTDMEHLSCTFLFGKSSGGGTSPTSTPGSQPPTATSVAPSPTTSVPPTSTPILAPSATSPAPSATVASAVSPSPDAGSPTTVATQGGQAPAPPTNAPAGTGGATATNQPAGPGEQAIAGSNGGQTGSSPESGGNGPTASSSSDSSATPNGSGSPGSSTGGSTANGARNQSGGSSGSVSTLQVNDDGGSFPFLAVAAVLTVLGGAGAFTFVKIRARKAL